MRYCLDSRRRRRRPSAARLGTPSWPSPSAATTRPVTTAMRAALPGQRLVDEERRRRLRHQPARRPQPADLRATRARAATACTASVDTYDQVVNITARTIVDTTPGRGRAELPVSSSVYLRNQNQAPVASFAGDAVLDLAHGRPQCLWLDGLRGPNARTTTGSRGRCRPSASIDCAQPTGRPAPASPPTLWGAAGYIGEGITLTLHVPAVRRHRRHVAHHRPRRLRSRRSLRTAGDPPQTPIAVAIPT